MTGDELTVSSELYTENSYESSSKPMANRKNVVSRFKFKFPPEPPTTDSEGDLEVCRKTTHNEKYGTIEIEHSQRTNLELVGLQIWRGALLLADWLLHNGNTFSADFYILELGSGVGLASIISSMFIPVLCTDINKGGLFKLINCNIIRNKHLTKHPIKVVNLDFLSQVLPQDIVKNISKIPIIIAADVIYDDVITEAFVKTVQHLLSKPPQRFVYVALEKRYVFTLADCDSVAPCYDHFLKCLDAAPNIEYYEDALDFPQYFEYDRVKELILLKITVKPVYEIE